jgi:hypothetical protein
MWRAVIWIAGDVVREPVASSRKRHIAAYPVYSWPAAGASCVGAHLPSAVRKAVNMQVSLTGSCGRNTMLWYF